MDLNVRVIKAVECCPTLYKGHASIEQRQVVWQQLAGQMRVPESVLKTRWHLLCNWYQRCLEKRRSTDDVNESVAGAERNDFRYEAEMAFMMPYIHARIAIAAANAARKQQELALAGANDLTEPEFVITESDIEQATTVSNELSAGYAFYEVETFEQEDLTDGGENVSETIENAHEDFNEGDYIQHIDESGNIVVQDIIYETGDQLSENGGEIQVEDEELSQLDEQIEVQNEEIIKEVNEGETHAPDEDEYITDTYDVMTTETSIPRTLRLPINKGQKYIKVIEPNSKKDSTTPLTQSENEQTPSIFGQELSLTSSRRHAVVLKATPRVQVELTDNAAANVLQHGKVENAADSSKTKCLVTDIKTDKKSKEQEVEINNDGSINCKIKSNNVKIKNEQTTKAQEEVSTINSTALASTLASTSTTSVSAASAGSMNLDSSTTERSEDAIFGELVAAMLKKMSTDRKRVIKKNIMDLLLT